MKTFHVVTQRNWMATELAAALEPAGWRVAQHYGLDALDPKVGHDPAHVLWAPGAFAAREILHGNSLRLSAPGPAWLPRLSTQDYVDTDPAGRVVELVTMIDAYDSPREGFWKLAETKHDAFPARWRTVGELKCDIRSAGLPPAALLQYTETKLTIVREYRAVVQRGVPTTVSCYLDNAGRDRSHPDFSEPASVLQRTAENIARSLAAEIEAQCPAGPAYTLDIARSGSRWLVLEANPVWSSAWYGCDLLEFADAVARAQGADVPEQHLWRPDALLVDRSRKAGPLPRKHGSGTAPNVPISGC